MKQIRIKINDLLDEHNGSFYDCKGCDTCTEIQRLSKLLERDPVEKFQYILNKRSDMTKSDIAFLLENDIQIKKIREYAGIPHLDFYQMMKNYGFSQNHPNRGRKQGMAKITLEEYQDLKAQGKTDRDIALIKKIHPSNLPPLKKQWGIGTTRYDKVEKKHSENKTTPKENNVTTSDYESLQIQLENQKQITEIQASQIEKLQDDLLEAGKVCKRLNSEAAELRNKVEDLENVNAACDDVENESARFKEERDNYLNQLLDSRDKLYRSIYTVQNQKKIIEDIKKTLERYEKENKALRELVALWI